MANVGFAPREVRLVILTAGPRARRPRRRAAPAARAYSPERRSRSSISLGLLAVLATITTIQRIVVTLNQASPSRDSHSSMEH